MFGGIRDSLDVQYRVMLPWGSRLSPLPSLAAASYNSMADPGRARLFLS